MPCDAIVLQSARARTEEEGGVTRTGLPCLIAGRASSACGSRLLLCASLNRAEMHALRASEQQHAKAPKAACLNDETLSSHAPC